MSKLFPTLYFAMLTSFGVLQKIVKPNLQTSWTGHQIDITGQTLAPNQITSSRILLPESGEDREGTFHTRGEYMRCGQNE